MHKIYIIFIDLYIGLASSTLYQSKYLLTSTGRRFQPIFSRSFLTTTSQKSRILCSQTCNRELRCRTFDFDLSTRVCRLFEASSDFGVITEGSPGQQVGLINPENEFYSSHGEPCSTCSSDRYLTCSSQSTCQCPNNTCWYLGQCRYYTSPNCSWISYQSADFNILWTFDNHLNDEFGIYHASAINSILYSTSYSGRGASLILSRLSSEYLLVLSPSLRLNATSFTLEAWIYPILTTTSEYGIFSQCQSTFDNLCLSLSISNYRLLFRIGSTILTGSRAIVSNQWCHVAFVFDASRMMQKVYLNGISDGNRSSSMMYEGRSGYSMIGATYSSNSSMNYFNGRIDELRMTSQVKTDQQILYDATAVVYYSFDGGLLRDNGVNRLDSSATGNIMTITGRMKQAIRLYSNSYLNVTGGTITSLGVSNQPYSFAFWVYPMRSNTEATLIFMTAPSGGWCMGMITITASGNIMVNTYTGGLAYATGPILPLNCWTHIVNTYSPANGLRLFINGSLYSYSIPINYQAAGIPVQMFIGNDFGYNGCTPGYGGFFDGALDEFYIFSRELMPSEVLSLANTSY